MLFYAMLYRFAVMQRCFISYDSVVLFYYGGLQNYNVVLCLVMMAYHFLILFCTDMFFVHTMPPWYSAAQRVLYQRQSVITFTYVHNRHNPRRYLIHRR